MKTVLLILSLFTLQAQADITCRAETRMGPAKVQISDSQVTISGAALDTPVVYPKIEVEYDGHMTEMITAKGLAISFADMYGCIRNATITANFRTISGTGYIETVKVSQCAGGSTPDHVCRVQ